MAAVPAVWCGPGWSLTEAVHDVVGQQALRLDYGRVPGYLSGVGHIPYGLEPAARLGRRAEDRG
jgi:hypothetical protein